MSFEVIRGDLIEEALEGRVDAIVHGCNCFHAMGGGIAGTLAKRFPEIPWADRNQTRAADPSKLGSYSLAHVTYESYVDQGEKEATRDLDNPFQCINLYTQFTPGKDFLPSLFHTGLHKINKDFKGKTLGFPLIGCGIAGGDWNFVMTEMVKYLPDVNVKVVLYV